MFRETDVLVIGGGIAGAAAAAFIAPFRDVLLLEQEQALAQHTTGRSAATFLRSYGSPAIRALTAASEAYLRGDRAERSVLSPRPLLWLARDEAEAEYLEQLQQAVPTLSATYPDDAVARCPRLRRDRIVSAAIELSACDIDVMSLHQRYMRTTRAHGGSVLTGAGVLSATRGSRGWQVETVRGDVGCHTVVNAAGAWADRIAALFGAASQGLRPLRRTIAVVRSSREVDPSWPLVAAGREDVYFRPEGPNVLLSPADETPSEPCDSRPDEVDVATGIDLVNDLTNLDIRSVVAAWSGLRTFAADRNPVIGRDPDIDDFIWFAGLGGYGIQTSPAGGELAAAAVLDTASPTASLQFGVDTSELAPGRETAQACPP